MKKKTKKSTQHKSKQKINVILESLLNLERVVKSLVAHIEQLRYSQSRFKDYEIPVKKEDNKYWPQLPSDINKPSWTSYDNQYVMGLDTDNERII